MIADTEAWLSVLKLGQCFYGFGVMTVQFFFSTTTKKNPGKITLKKKKLVSTLQNYSKKSKFGLQLYKKKCRKNYSEKRKVGFQLWGANLGLLLTKSIKLKFLALPAQNASIR